MKRRDWTLARAKVDAEGVCRACGRRCSRLEAAHIIGRAHDDDPPVRTTHPTFPGIWRAGVVHPDRVIPLGGPATDTTTCHGKQHARRLDLLPLLDLHEQLQAVADAGGVSQALDRLAPTESHRRVRSVPRAAMPGD